MLWTPTCNHGFEVKSYYNSLQSRKSRLFPWKSVWKVKAPPHIAWGKICTTNNLRRQGFTLVNLCCQCKRNEETLNHLIVHCEFTSGIWHLVLILFRVSWIMPNNPSVVALLEDSKVWILQRSRLESYLNIVNVEHLERKKSPPID
jgi:hypothetical protein